MLQDDSDDSNFVWVQWVNNGITAKIQKKRISSVCQLKTRRHVYDKRKNKSKNQKVGMRVSVQFENDER